VDAKEPLRPENVPDEIGSLIAAIDALVERHQQALEAQRRFVADAAHELRTPLAALQIQTENLSAVDLSDPTRELADELGAGVRRASHLADQLLAMARAEGATMRVRNDVDLAHLIASILPDFVSLAEAKGIELAVNAGQRFPVKSDPGALRKILAVLLDNAIRYSAPGGSVEIKLGVVGHTPRLEIVDSGPGIPHEAMPFIYDRFFRAVPQDAEGTGLGLAIARAAADRNNLRLSHRNRKDTSGIIAVIEFPPWTTPASGLPERIAEVVERPQ
jgi:two-component system, OmpR family, sensor kinase